MGRYAKGIQNTICATKIDKTPSLKLIAEKKINVATAVTISGTIIGNEIKPKDADLPLKFPPLTIPIEAAVATIVAIDAAIRAITREFQAASLNFSDSRP